MQTTQPNATDCRRGPHTDYTKKAIIKLRNKTQVDGQDYLQAKLALLLATAPKLMGLASIRWRSCFWGEAAILWNSSPGRFVGEATASGILINPKAEQLAGRCKFCTTKTTLEEEASLFAPSFLCPDSKGSSLLKIPRNHERCHLYHPIYQLSERCIVCLF